MIVTKEYWTLHITSPMITEPPAWRWFKWHYEYDPADPLNAQTTHMRQLDYREFPVAQDKYHQIAERLLREAR